MNQIIFGQAEQDRVVYQERDEKTGFTVVMDTKWDEQSMDQLYLVALCEDHSLHTLRDLTGDHVSLLTHIRNTTLKTISTKYHVSPDKILVYVHYLPSFMRFHIHFQHHLHSQASTPRSHMIDDVIDNLQRDGTYYQTASLSFLLKENHQIIQWMQDNSEQPC